MVLADRRVKVCKLAKATGILTEQRYFILHNRIIHEKTLCKVGASSAYSRTKANPYTNISRLFASVDEFNGFLRRFVTMDEN